MNIKALWREPSTKRGCVMLVTGGMVLYQTVFGGGTADIAGLEMLIERWIGVGMMLAGLLGWLPDTAKESPREDLPPIELVSRPAAGDLGSLPAAGAEPVGMRQSMRARHNTEEASDMDPQRPGFNG
jgi:hypothetical protein